jgi:hypothetical protein
VIRYLILVLALFALILHTGCTEDVIEPDAETLVDGGATLDDAADPTDAAEPIEDAEPAEDAEPVEVD